MSITNSIISFNASDWWVGGIGNDGGTITIQGSQVTNNTAYQAAGIYNNTGPATITDTAITFNHATGADGGGLWTIGANVTMTNCVVTNNTAARVAGGIENTSWMNVFIPDEGPPVVTLGPVGVLELCNSTVSDNTAGVSGGGIVNSDPYDLRPDTHEPAPATMNICDSTLNGNSAGVSGGAGAVFAGSLTMTGCTVNGNSAYQYGGGMYIDPAVATIIACTFAGNTAPLGADLFNEDSAITIIASNIAGIYSIGGTIAHPIANLLAQVAALNLSSGQTNSLTSILQAAQQSLANANTTAAVSQLNAFINQLNALVNSHRLGELTVDSLINEIDNLVELIG